jgi:DNA-binding IclR family transcriptional regulator
MRTMPLPTVDPTADLKLASGLAPVDVLARVRNEFREMPGLCLTTVQAQRLWYLDESTCTRVLSTLVREGYLRRSAKGFVKA